MNWTGKRVLVTGAGGFIGSHLCELLAERGARVRALVHYNALGSRGWLDSSPLRKEMEIVAGDIRDRDSVRRAMLNVEKVFHLAALIAIPYSYEAPGSYVETNVMGTLNLLQTARESTSVDRIVHTSTSEVYGTALRIPIDEEHPLQGQSPYSASKIGADKMAEAFHRSFGLPVVTVRPFNTFGPRQSARAVIPTIVSQCLSGAEVIRLGSLSPRRDMNFVQNTTTGFLAAAASEKAIGRVINLGSSSEISIGHLARKIACLTGHDNIKIKSEEKRQRPENSEVDRLLADNTLARKLLDWRPVVGLDEGLRRTVQWTRGHLDKYRPEDYTV